MGKTRDAFALRELDFGQLNFSLGFYADEFKQGKLLGFDKNYDSAVKICSYLDKRKIDFFSESYLQTPFDYGGVDFLMKYVDIDSIKFVTSPPIDDEALSRHLRLKEILNRINRHIVRLQKYLEITNSKILKSDFYTFDVLKAKLQRAHNLKLKYLLIWQTLSTFRRSISFYLRKCDKDAQKIFDSYIGGKIKDARRKRGWTQANMADWLNITENTYQKYELGTITLDLFTACRLCKLLKISLDDL